MEKFHCILVKDKAERAVAMEAGWDRKNCILPRRVFLEGRRMHSLTITWGALEYLIDTRDTDYLLAVIHQNITIMREKVPVRIDNPNVPPPLDEVASAEVNHLRDIAEGRLSEPADLPDSIQLP